MTVPENNVLRTRLAECDLLSATQVAQVCEEPVPDPHGLAERLVQSGWLTPWQVSQLLAGRTRFVVAGRYRLLDRLARGGMATILRATDVCSRQTVAIKVLRECRRHDPVAVSLFIAECRLTTRLDHPHIVHGLATGCEEGRHFLVMEFVPGPNLKACLRYCGPLPVGWSCECGRQLADALQYTHERGLFHGDLKPANVVMPAGTPVPDVKLLDLGVSGLADRWRDLCGTVLDGFAVGTADYMAPERFRGIEEADIRSDIFSLGCTLFELLTGRLPFPGDTPAETLQARVAGEVPRASTLRTDVPPELDGILARMLAPSPAERFPTPAEAAEALLPFRDGTDHAGEAVLLQALQLRDPWDECPTTPSEGARLADGTTRIAARHGE